MIVVAVIAAVLLLVLFLVGYIPNQPSGGRRSPPIITASRSSMSPAQAAGEGFDLVCRAPARFRSVHTRANGYLGKLWSISAIA
jgi:hypothetical protein